MFRASITLPASLQKTDIEKISQNIQAVAQISLRDGSHIGPWKIEWLFDQPPNIAALTANISLAASTYDLDLPSFNWFVESINANTDWLAENYRSFPPFSVGPFFLYGSHYEGEPPKDQIGLQIDAATAFGSGEHGTTKGCLQAMLDLKGAGVCPWNILDMGTGSGILAIAAWKLWKTPVLATDIDPESIRVTQRHAAINGVRLSNSALKTQTGDGFTAPLVSSKSPYELIIANILAGPVISFAPELSAVTDKPGYTILSGMLIEQSDCVLAAYEAQGFSLKHRYNIGEWSTLLLQRQ